MAASQNGVCLSVAGKVALITGGSRGIGAAAVKMFCAAGAKVAFNYQKAKNEADAVVSACGADVCAAIQADLASVEAAEKLVRATVTKFGRLDLLIVNHGIWPPDDVAVDQMTEDQWRKTIATNLDSVFGLIKHSVAQMKGQREKRDGQAAGRVVLISSTAGQRGEAFHCDYAATKGAVISMVKGLSTELARDRIYVNCVAPGWVATDMSAPAMNDAKTRERVLATIPLGRIGAPEEIAAPILFLCTEYAGFITGEILNVNGGAVLAG
jgi:3-oxoacyl-[acyl-carrier protein] reductase